MVLFFGFIFSVAILPGNFSADALYVCRYVHVLFFCVLIPYTSVFGVYAV